MIIFKHRRFLQWAKSECIADVTLIAAVSEITAGLHNGNLGSGLYKKRVPMPGKGKSGSYRTLIAFKQNDKAFFIHGFSKNAKDNIDAKEKEIYKQLASILLNADSKTLANMIEMGSLMVVKENE